MAATRATGRDDCCRRVSRLGREPNSDQHRAGEAPGRQRRTSPGRRPLSLVAAMHSISSRVSNVSAFLSSCLMGLVLAVAVTSALYQMYQTPPTGELAVTNIKVCVDHSLTECYLLLTLVLYRLPGKGRYSRKYGTRQQQDFAFVNLNLTAGVSSVIPPGLHRPTRDLALPLSAYHFTPPLFTSSSLPPPGHAAPSPGVSHFRGPTYQTALPLPPFTHVAPHRTPSQFESVTCGVQLCPRVRSTSTQSNVAARSISARVLASSTDTASQGRIPPRTSTQMAQQNQCSNDDDGHATIWSYSVCRARVLPSRELVLIGPWASRACLCARPRVDHRGSPRRST